MEVLTAQVQAEARSVHQMVVTREERLVMRAGSNERAFGEDARPGVAPGHMRAPTDVWIYEPRGSDQAQVMPGGLSLVQMVLETFFHMKVRVFLPDDFAPSRSEGGSGVGAPGGASPPSEETAQGWSLRWDRSEVREQLDSLDIRVSGAVETGDGRTVSFDLALNMRRYQREEVHQTLTAGDPWQDPLVLALPGQGVPDFKSDGRMRLDLNGDGREEDLPLLTGQAGYLVWDRNGNDRVDDGTELIGALSGDGFAELREWDQDGNTWIDARDPVFMDLRFWQPEANRLTSLTDLGVGALSTTGVGAGTWALGDEARLRQSGLALYEDGQASWVHQVDLRAGE